MLSKTFRPLRSTVGNPLEISNARIIKSSRFTHALVELDANINNTINNPFNLAFLSQSIDIRNPDQLINSGLASIPLPHDLPFISDQHLNERSYARLVGISQDPSEINGIENNWIDIELSFKRRSEQLVGGIVYAGHPFVAYYINKGGENSANFALPREIRVSWQIPSEKRFIDADNSVTYQSSAAHCGTQIISIGPLNTDRLTIRLADFPRIFKYRKRRNKIIWKEYSAFFLRFLYVFEYSESTRYTGSVLGGLIGAIQRPPNLSHSLFSQLASQVPETDINTLYAGACPDLNTDKGYHMSCASIFGQNREYLSIPQGRHFGGETFKEFFCSNELNPEDDLSIFVMQAEDECRCLAGLRLSLCKSFQNLTRSKIALSILELDPSEGEPHLFLLEEKLSKRRELKYSGLLFRGDISPDKKEIVCRFKKPTSTRYLLLIFQNNDEKPGYVMVRHLEIIQSAHVTVSPKYSRSQMVQALHFRIVSKDLADDYSKLGKAGISFTIEHLNGGVAAEKIFSANSLVELLNSGIGRLQATSRRRVSESEVVNSGGWNRSETGFTIEKDDPRWQDPERYGLDEHGFKKFGRSELRNRTEHVGPLHTLLSEMGVTLDSDRNIDSYNRLKEVQWVKDHGPGRLWTFQDLDWPAWQNRDGTKIDQDRLELSGLYAGSISPAHAFIFPKLRDAFQKMMDLEITGPNEEQPFDFAFQMEMLQYFLLSGLGFGINISTGASFIASIGGGLSFSGNTTLPTLIRNSTAGTLGTMLLQGFNTEYAYSQHEEKGSIKRTIERIPLSNDKRRFRGVEVVWQNEATDIVSGTIPISILLPALRGKMYESSDNTLRVRISGNIEEVINFDIWFDIKEEVIHDDY